MVEKFASWNGLVEDFIVEIACGLANAAGYDRRLQRGAETLARRFHCKSLAYAAGCDECLDSHNIAQP